MAKVICPVRGCENSVNSRTKHKGIPKICKKHMDQLPPVYRDYIRKSKSYPAKKLAVEVAIRELNKRQIGKSSL